MYSKLAVKLLMLCSITSAVLSATVPKKANEMADQMGKEFSILQKVYDDCHDKSDFTGCLKGKAVKAISRAVEQVSLLIHYHLNESFINSFIHQLRIKFN